MDKRIVTYLFAISFFAMAWSPFVQAQDSYIYSYERYGSDEAAWALLPIPVNLPEHRAQVIFEILKQRKRSSYGATRYDAQVQRVDIDAEKSAHSMIITAEISESFAAHGLKLPSFYCDGKAIDSHPLRLPIFAPILPLWLAFSSDDVPQAAHVRIGEAVVSYDKFKLGLRDWDADILWQIEALLDAPELAIQTSVMASMLAQKAPKAQERIAARLSSPKSQTRLAAFFALRQSRDRKSIAALRQTLDRFPNEAEALARYALESPDASLRQKAMRISLASGHAEAFELAVKAIEKTGEFQVISQDFGHLLDKLSPEQASTLTKFLIRSKAAHSASEVLESQAYQLKTEAIAQALIATYPVDPEDAHSTALLLPALALMLESPDVEQASDALWKLKYLAKTAASPSLSRAFLRGVLSPHPSLREDVLGYLMQTSTAGPSAPFSRLAALSQSAALSAELSFILSKGLTQPRQSFQAAASDLERRAAILAQAKAGDLKLMALAQSPQVKAALLLSTAKHSADDPELLEALRQMAVSTETGLRRDAAFALRFLGSEADALRLLLLKDSDDAVASVAIRSLNDVRHAHLARDLIGIVKTRTAQPRITALWVLPSLLNEANTTAIASFAANEVFDEALAVKVAAQTALARIARESVDLMTAENAVASLALTLQDKDPQLRRLTLLALAQSQRASATPLIEAGLKANPTLSEAVKLRDKVLSATPNEQEVKN